MLHQMGCPVEIVTERATLGEGPHWEVATQSLYYVDIVGQAIHKYIPATNSHTKAVIGKKITYMITCIIFYWLCANV